MTTFDGPSRYVADARATFATLREAAEKYPLALAPSGLEWIRRKPYDPMPGHPHFFNCMYAALNAIQALELSPDSLVIEIGSGPGWLTEILVGLGYRVVAIEPSEAMNNVAAQRIEGFGAILGIPADRVTFITATLEEAELSQLQQQADAVMFHEALHHVIDEHEAMERVFSLLRPDGQLCVCGEGRWNPGDEGLESVLDLEMETYGTLESPFTQPYLRHLLESTGFLDVVFYHTVNGLFPEKYEERTIAQVARPSVLAANTVIARRPTVQEASGIPSAAAAPERTAAEIKVLHAKWEGDVLDVQAELRNSGDTYWPGYRPQIATGVTLALTPELTAFPELEALNRYWLPKSVFPGETIEIQWQFSAPGLQEKACFLRLVTEGVFWFEGGQAVS